MLKHKLFFAILYTAVFVISPTVQGMHIMEGYLSPKFCIAWGALALPFLAWGVRSIRKQLDADKGNITLLAMSGAFIFVISSLKIPSLTGSCSHMTGTGLGAILFGPATVSVLGVIVLLFQALLLAHGGLTTLGANTVSMAIAGPFLSYGVYYLCKKWNWNKKIGIFSAAFLGNLFTYVVTSLQLAVAFPSQAGGVAASAIKFLGVFAPTQLPLAIVEGLVTVVIMIVLETYGAAELALLAKTKEDQTYGETE